MQNLPFMKQCERSLGSRFTHDSGVTRLPVQFAVEAFAALGIFDSEICDEVKQLRVIIGVTSSWPNRHLRQVRAKRH